MTLTSRHFYVEKVVKSIVLVYYYLTNKK